jgi:hypothetical protein
MAFGVSLVELFSMLVFNFCLRDFFEFAFGTECVKLYALATAFALIAEMIDDREDPLVFVNTFMRLRGNVNLYTSSPVTYDAAINKAAAAPAPAIIFFAVVFICMPPHLCVFCM